MKKHRRYLSADQHQARDIVRYIKDHPELEPHEERFAEIVTDRMHDFVYTTVRICNLLQIDDMNDPRYRYVRDRIEDMYRTWAEIAAAVVQGKEIDFRKRRKGKPTS